MEKSCARCGEKFEAKRADRMYCSDACKQAAVRARRGVNVARRPPEPQGEGILQRLADLEDRQRNLFTELDELEQRVDGPKEEIDLSMLLQRVEAVELRVEKMGKTLEVLSRRQREHETALTKVAELLAAEPWRRR